MAKHEEGRVMAQRKDRRGHKQNRERTGWWQTGRKKVKVAKQGGRQRLKQNWWQGVLLLSRTM